MITADIGTVCSRAALLMTAHFIWQPVEMIQFGKTQATFILTKMIDFLYTSVLKKTQLMPSHLYKYLSGDYLILQAIDSYPSIPRPGCLEHPLHLVLWHHKKLLFPLLFFCAKPKLFTVITSKEEACHCLATVLDLVMVNHEAGLIYCTISSKQETPISFSEM